MNASFRSFPRLTRGCFLSPQSRSSFPNGGRSRRELADLLLEFHFLSREFGARAARGEDPVDTSDHEDDSAQREYEIILPAIHDSTLVK